MDPAGVGMSAALHDEERPGVMSEVMVWQLENNGDYFEDQTAHFQGSFRGLISETAWGKEQGIKL